ncbi:MAG: peptidoglycan-binding domain-containing protein [Candidatus Palauibacterales bacterium]|nr:peptidoglycan-binding domain-containing protein [Candidatus Palauibacterales bacterium]MDP2528783.1 peptidoglycan-binding domain-containing protein [Candidatus Palauibacterales bacterium]MDP2583631.1 peptidoglycan-binding domain-containing protein [Candidatus Palauibacterales bacterium]
MERRAVGAAFPAVLGFTVILALAGPARAQMSPGPAPEAASSVRMPIPVVERFDPATGRRARRTVSQLTVGEIVTLQAGLGRVGQDPGVRSGSLDRATRSALSAFQRERGLPPCGCPSYATVVALGLEPRVVETVIAAGGRGPAFGHPTTGPAKLVSSGAAGAGTRGSVSVTSESGVVVVRGSGSGNADGRDGRRAPPPGAAGEAPGPAGAASPAGPASSAGPLYGAWILPGARGPGRGGRVGRPGHGGTGAAGGGTHARPPIPYAPRLPEPRPAAPGLPAAPPPAPKSGSGGGG